jgi:hypothetical protein
MAMVRPGIPSRHAGAANLVVAMAQAFCVAAANHGGRAKAYDRKAVVAPSSVSGGSDAL